MALTASFYRVCAATAFLAAALLFSVQMMLGKTLLPLVGGTPGGWLTALCFFQLALLAGYGLTAYFSRYSRQQQMVATLLVLAAGLPFLPVHLVAVSTALPEAVQVLLVLTKAVLVPFLALSMMSGALQRLAAQVLEDKAYRLYAWSNAGSFVGLLSYPIIIEAFIPLSRQAQFWMLGYSGLILCTVLCLVLARKNSAAPVPVESVEARPAPGFYQQGMWVVLAAVPSSLSFGLTTLITTEFGGSPLFWVLPLAIYLLTYIIAFASDKQPGFIGGSLAVLFAVAAASDSHGGTFTPLSIFLTLLAFFLMAWAIHARLAASRPPVAHLTHFYLVLATGGALGGLFNALVIPWIMPYPLEFFLSLILGALLLARCLKDAYALLLVGSLSLFLPYLDMQRGLVTIQRNFYGSAIVRDISQPDGRSIRSLVTGVAVQGQQIPQSESHLGPIVPLMGNPERREIGVVGFGVGMTLCLQSPGRHYTIYEIDPKFRAMGEEFFTYVRDCGSPQWRMGDGRLILDSEVKTGAQPYDALIVDAFQNLHPPVHLLTQEAMAIYRARIKPQGLLMMNLTSFYYDFFPQMAAQAQAMGWQMWVHDLPYHGLTTRWAVMARSDVDLNWLEKEGWRLYPASGDQVWTDDLADPLSALNSLVSLRRLLNK
jgi:hypothetical protein